MSKLALFFSALALLLVSSQAQLTANVCNSGECRFGQCEVTSASTFACHCSAGITGARCDRQSTSTNPCLSNPCFNGGLCTSPDNVNFICTCPAGLAGPTCQAVISNTCTCQNNQPCLTSVSSTGQTLQTCNCASPFGGNVCQFRIAPFQSCFTTPCQNGGTCTILATCACPAGFSGNLCQTPTAITTAAPAGTTLPSLNLCAFPGICKNGGTCFQNTTNLARCLCAPGFTGLFCDIPTTPTVAPTTNTIPCPASLTLCQNGANCVINLSTNSFQCVCAPGFSGATCATTQAFCASNPCRNGGVCTTTNAVTGAGACTCQAGTVGLLSNCRGTVCDFCDVPAATCNASCNNNLCSSIAGVITCFCQNGSLNPNCA